MLTVVLALAVLAADPCAHHHSTTTSKSSTSATSKSSTSAKPASTTSAVSSTTSAASSTTSEPNVAWNALLTGFELNAGWRWESAEQSTPACPPIHAAPPPVPPKVHDPFYLGATLRLPVASQLDLCGAFDRDFVEAPEWQARAYVAFRPWGHH